MHRTSGSFLKRASVSSGSLAANLKDYPTNANEYKLLEECGRGVSATVWRALCIPYNEEVAVKLLDLENVNCSLDEIVREAQTMRQQSHPCVLPLYCSFVHEQNLWMVMPYVAGGSVLNIMKYAYPEGLEEPVIATILKEVLKGLEYMHKQGGIHRDVKAGNILINTDGQVVLADFGVAATMERGGSWGNKNVARNTFVGTPCWMAPEVMEQTQGYNSLADIWSFGITILELAHGHAPFARYPPMKVLLMTIQNPPPSLESDAKKHFSKAMRDIVAKCLVKDPSKRPSAAQLLEHKFFKTAHDQGYIVKHLLAGLPSVTERVKAMRQGRNGNNVDDAKNRMFASQEAYIKGVSAWNFDVAALKEQAAKEGGMDATLAPIIEGATSDAAAQPANTAGESGGLSVEVPSGWQSPTGKPPLASPGHAPPVRTSSERSLSAASTPGKAPLAGSGGSLPPANAAHPGKGVAIKGDRGRFKVYEGEAPPPLSPVQTNGAALMEANLKPTTPEPRGSNASLDGSEAGSRPASESGEVAAAKEAHKKGRFKIVEDDITAQEAKAARRTATSDKVAEGRAPGMQGGEGGKPINPTAAKILLPALKELMQGMGTQYDLLKEVVAAVQDTERGRQSSINTLLAEVSERSYPKLSREDADRLKQENAQLKEEVQRLMQRIRVMEEEISRQQRYAGEEA
ncbi:probable serine/threonine-protein kinase OSR1 at N-terminal half [Coccomyxa sp. Obi]|nr:probable serine/threonine-protein kinase OSR1 at N-terminal half [Coccomyxa sp. Obi]